MARLLLGFMGAGKTTVARQVDKNFLDMDTMIEERLGMPIAKFFALKGETAFRQIETQVLEEVLELPQNRLVSTGGGVVISDYNRQLLRKNKADNIYLSASFDVIYKRLSRSKAELRPIFANNSRVEFENIFNKRVKLYEEVAGRVIDVNRKSPKEIARMIRCK